MESEQASSASANSVPEEVRSLTTLSTPENEKAPTKLGFVRAEETRVNQSEIILTPREVAGPIGKLISRAGADAQVAHAETVAAIKELDIAEQIDARGDAEVRAAAKALFYARRATTAAERESFLRVAGEHMVRVMQLDDLEDEHIASAAERVTNARAACRLVVDRTETALTQRAEVA